MTATSSRELFSEAVKVIPGGVNSPVRAFGSVGGSPRFIARAAGAVVWDVEGNSYIDYVGSWGPLILGHAHPEAVAAVCEAARRGVSFGAPTAGEVTLAKMIVERIPSIQMVRLVNSGTEATMTALRVARGFTRREKVIKFSGCYHGHSDAFLVKAGSGAATLGVPTSPGVPAAVAAGTVAVEFNDLGAVREVFSESPGEVAAVIVEPICGNAGVILPEPGFLEGLRELCTANGALLIFDEVMTGFRIRPGSAQALYGITPDLTTLGKIVGGGLPIGAVGGRADVMKLLAPAGPVYQAGTLSGNPVAVAAGIATLRGLNGAVYDRLEALGARLEAGIWGNLARCALPGQFQRAGSMATLFFTDRPVRCFRDAQSCDLKRFAAYFRAMLAAGVYLPPSQFEAFFISAAHTEEQIDRTIAANGAAMEETIHQ
jgi:glutamate-1-semialdehyde 2,1-aminomutase